MVESLRIAKVSVIWGNYTCGCVFECELYINLICNLQMLLPS